MCGGQCQPGQSDFWKLGYADIIGIMAFIIGLQNLSENREQSAQSDKLIQQIDVDAANDKQAKQILSEIGKRLDGQDAMLKEILEVITHENAVREE